MRKIAMLLLSCLLVLNPGTSAMAAEPIRVWFGDEMLPVTDSLFVEDGRIFVPMRTYFESQGASVTWDGETRTAIGVRGHLTFRIPGVPLGSTNPVIIREITEWGVDLTLGIGVRIINDRMFIPLREVSEALGDTVVWDSTTRQATVIAEHGPGESTLAFRYDFSESAHGWVGAFTDLPVGYDKDLYELEFDHAMRPVEVGEGRALMLQGHNRSDDLFMYVRKGLTEADGIRPNTTYRISFEVELATDAPAGAVGIGGPPGEAVWVKVGAAPVEPVPVEQEAMALLYYLLNVDKGNQNNDGDNALRIGDVAKTDNDDFVTYELKTLDNRNQPLEISSDSQGNLWIFVGTDSGFEGKTVLYYTSIQVWLIPVN